MFYLYYIENMINGKIYIGKSKNPIRRWAMHKSIARGSKTTYKNSFLVVHKALQKYGIDNFVFNVFSSSVTELEIYEQEKYWIEYLSNVGITLYNQCEGGLGAMSGDKHPGFGKFRTDEVKKKISVANKGKFVGELNPNFGKKHTQDSLIKISEAAKNRIQTQETKSKISNTLNSLTKEQRNIEYGEKHHSAKLTESDVVKIIQLIKEGTSNSNIARVFGVHRNTIQGIRSGKKWKHLER